jgi:hypothetical protein
MWSDGKRKSRGPENRAYGGSSAGEWGLRRRNEERFVEIVGVLRVFTGIIVRHS